MMGNPLLQVLDFSSLRLVSCGGSPQSPTTIYKAIAAFGCEFFVSLLVDYNALPILQPCLKCDLQAVHDVWKNLPAEFQHPHWLHTMHALSYRRRHCRSMQSLQTPHSALQDHL
jgi:hypothetical protein